METSKNHYAVQQAGLNDFNDLKSLLNKANQHSVASSGLRQWTVMDHVYSQLQRQIENGECYLHRNGQGETVAAVALNEDPGQWGARGDDRDAVYFYKLMKDPEKADKGEGAKLLGFVAQEALRRGKRFLRCDTVNDLTGLHAYYARFGFQEVGSFTYASSGRAGVLLEASARVVLDTVNNSN